MTKFAITILLLGILLFSGCVSVGQTDSTALPWSEPRPWEGQTLGVPVQ